MQGFKQKKKMGKNKIKTALFGLGRIGQMHANNLRKNSDFELKYVFFLHGFNILVGHLNHSNIKLDYGILKFIFNNPKMHIWHHAKEYPVSHPNGVNFGITLS